MTRTLCVAVGLLWASTACLQANTGTAFSALPTVGGENFNLTLSHEAPTELDTLQAVVKLRDTTNIALADLERDGRVIRLRFNTSCALHPCPEYAVDHTVPLGRLEAGAWRIEAMRPGLTLALDFTVAPVVEQGELRLIPHPAAPTEADLVQMQVLYRTAPCQEPPLLAGMWHSEAEVFVDLALTEVPATCADEEGELGSLLVEVGGLPAGEYFVYLRGFHRDPPLPIQLQSFAYTVAPRDHVVLQGRYRVRLEWRTAAGLEGVAHPVAGGSEESALFTFFSPDNWEVMVKVLDGCAINGNRWVFLSAATDVEFTLTVEDLEGAAPPYVYHSPAGLNPPLGDTAAFSCAP